MLECGMQKVKAIVALCLLVPVPSLGVLFGMILYPDTPLGAGVFVFSKIWIFALPLVWCGMVEKKRLSLSPARRGGFGVAVLSGVAISVAIVAVYLLAGDALLDRSFVAQRLRDVGLGKPVRFGLGVAYWILVNSVLEEYVWRWFCVEQCKALAPRAVAVVVSAACFTVHHVVAMLVYLDPWSVVMACAGVFLGATVWSAMYIRYRSIWPGYVSHAIVDVAIFGIAATIIF